MATSKHAFMVDLDATESLRNKHEFGAKEIMRIDHYLMSQSPHNQGWGRDKWKGELAREEKDNIGQLQVYIDIRLLGYPNILKA